jgi:hypothetical protein
VSFVTVPTERSSLPLCRTILNKWHVDSNRVWRAIAHCLCSFFLKSGSLFDIEWQSPISVAPSVTEVEIVLMRDTLQRAINRCWRLPCKLSTVNEWAGFLLHSLPLLSPTACYVKKGKVSPVLSYFSVVTKMWPASHPGRFTLWERAPSTYLIEDSVGPNTGLRDEETIWLHQDSNSGPSVVQSVASRYTDCAIP